MTKLYELHRLFSSGTNSYELEEIYRLRLKCWAKYLKVDDHPMGWSDGLDESAVHFFIKNEQQIIAAARLNVLNSIDEIPIATMFRNYGYDESRNIGYISRNVVDPEYRNLGLSKMLDIIRLSYLTNNDIRRCFADANQARMEKLVSYGFSVLGRIPQFAEENYRKDPDTYVMVKEFVK